MSGEGEVARVRKRSSVGAAGAGAATSMAQSGHAEETKRTTRAASKRAAIDDGARTANAAAGPQQAKKRAALANLSNNATLPLSRSSSPDMIAKKRAALASLPNNVSIPAVRNSITAGKGAPTAAKGKGLGPPAQLKAAEVEATVVVKGEKVAAPEKPAKSAPSVAGQESRENLPPNPAEIVPAVPSAPENLKADSAAAVKVSDEVPSVTAAKQPVILQSDAAVIASLERKTLENLYISRNTKVTLGQELGWSISSQLAQQDTSSPKTESYTDIDCDHTDPQMCSTYAVDIYQHLRMQEVKRRPTTEFMEGLQQDINPSMRGILIDWLVEVAEEYKLVPDTLYLTVSYIDRFLSKNVVNRQRLQLLGVSCMLIAAKYEEICAPQVEEFCYITDNTYAREEVLEMERRVLTNLHFELTTPTTKSFLRRFIRASQAGTPELQLEFLGNYLAELTLVEYTFLHYLPSIVAASAVFVARLTLYGEPNAWTSTLRHYTGYRASELKDCVKEIHDLQTNSRSCTLPAIREKYSHHKFKCVASLPSVSTIPPHCFEDNEA